MYVGMAPVDLVYLQGTGGLFLADSEDNRTLLARGYSGSGSGRNNPEAEKIRAVGPIPRGVWRVDTPRHHPTLGPLVFPLVPVAQNAHGRTGFYIHGDNAKGNGSASTGCIVIPRAAREAIRALGIKVLVVE